MRRTHSADGRGTTARSISSSFQAALEPTRTSTPRSGRGRQQRQPGSGWDPDHGARANGLARPGETAETVNARSGCARAPTLETVKRFRADYRGCGPRSRVAAQDSTILDGPDIGTKELGAAACS